MNCARSCPHLFTTVNSIVYKCSWTHERAVVQAVSADNNILAIVSFIHLTNANIVWTVLPLKAMLGHKYDLEVTELCTSRTLMVVSPSNQALVNLRYDNAMF